MRIRWKKNPKPTGLAAVGSGPQSSVLHDGTSEYAYVYPSGGDWRRPLKGWFWVCRGQDLGGEYKNTCNSPCKDEQQAKTEAMEYVKTILKNRK